MKQTTKGQAALEFLSTYGFAFLIILVMIGALAYFGVLNPQNLLPERCQTGPELNCLEYLITEDGSGGAQVNIRLVNQRQQAMRNDATYTLTINASSQGNSGTCTLEDPAPTSGPIAAGDIFEIQCVFPGLYVQGQRLRAEFDIGFYRPGLNFPSTVSGDVFARMN